MHNNGRSYVACSRCNTKLKQNGTSLRCRKCVTAHASGLLRYRVELSVRDDHDSGTFAVFGSEMTKILLKTAVTLTAASAGMDEGELPPSLASLAGLTFMFQLKVTSYNFPPRHKTFTVVRMTAQPAADGAKEGGGGDLPPPDNPPPPPKKNAPGGFANDMMKEMVVGAGGELKNNRKRPRE